MLKQLELISEHDPRGILISGISYWLITLGVKAIEGGSMYHNPCRRGCQARACLCLAAWPWTSPLKDLRFVTYM